MIEVTPLFLMIFLLFVFFLLGRSLTALIYVNENSIGFSFEIICGYAVFSAIALLCMRAGVPLKTACIGSLIFCLVFAIVLYKNIDYYIHDFKFLSSAIIPFTFSCVVLAVLLPLAIHNGSQYVPPPIYDLPKHLLAIVSVASETRWPPMNPLYPSGDFAYNYIFYILPAFVDVATGLSDAHFSVFPVQIAIFAGFFVAALARLSGEIGVPYNRTWLTSLFATFIGGLHPLIVHGFPPMGYQLGVEQLADRQVWGEDPIIYATYVPQHVFAIVASLISLSVLIGQNHIRLRVGVATILAFSASNASLILLPHVNIIVAIGTLVFFIRNRPWSIYSLMPVFIIFLAYACISLIFVWQARGWAPPDTVFASWQPLGRTDIFLFVTYGLTGLLGVLGLVIAFRRDQFAWHSWPLILVAASMYSLTVVLKYPDAGLKSAAALRMVLVIFAGRGCSELLTAFPQRSVRVGLASAIFGSALIGTPFAISLLQWQKNTQADAAGIALIQKSAGPILIDDGVQWDAALTGHPVTMDFRGYRADSYLPASERGDADAFFDRLRSGDPQTLHETAAKNNMVVTTANRVALWRSEFGEPTLVTPSRVIFERHPKAIDAVSPQ